MLSSSASYKSTIMITLASVSAVPDSYCIFQSNVFSEEQYVLRDPQCNVTTGDGKRDSEGGVLLTCMGPSSALFDGVIGQDRPERMELLLKQYYTWQQEYTPRPYVSMSFNPPLVEISNITLYFYRRGPVRAPYITMCFSRSLSYTPCNSIELPERPQIENGVVVWPVTLSTNVTSVTYMRIDMQHEDEDDDDDYIFLSEIRVAERLQGLWSYILLNCNYCTLYKE